MGLSAHEVELIGALLRHPEGLTVADLADRLGVSARTVHRNLQSASEFLGRRDLTLVRRAGRGVRVEGTNGARDRALEDLRDVAPAALSPEERRISLLRRLLGSDEPIKLRALASELKVSVGTVSRDLDGVEDWLADLGLSLLRKPGYGVEVVGTEADLRLAVGRLILENLDEATLLPRPKAPDSPPAGLGESRVSDRLLGMVDEDRLRMVETLVGETVERLPYAIADSAFVNLSIHVALMVERLLQGAKVEMGDDILQRLSNTVEYDHATGLAGAIAETFRVDVPEEEVAYITMHLRGTKLSQDDALERYLETSDLELASRTKALIHFVGEQTGVSLAGDSSLYTGLLAHVERAIHRLREGLTIYNPLLSEIKEDYPALFDLVDRGMKKVFVDEEIPDEEVGFVAMHFGAALDRGQGGFPRSVLVICPAGIASARMLASRLEKAFPQIRTIRNTSLFELGRIAAEEFDLVVSTVPLPIPEGSYVQAPPLLSEYDVERIKDHLRQKNPHARLAERAASESLEVFGGGQAKFFQMAEATQIIAELLEQVFVRHHEARGSIPDAVSRMCASLAALGVVAEAERLEEALLSRMERGGIGIPGTTLALFHARGDMVVRSSFSVHEFDEPLVLEGMDGAMMRVRRSLLMVAPLELSPIALEAISEISLAMVEQPAEREVFEEGSEARIVEVLDGIFARYLQNKLA
ncbi:MAG TPA: BglG family transcription antiterminator [Rubrobacteraceae bacterium]|nr:BglG family transcription antiterminator [Rubrobacteraceae bacterium]